MILKTHEQLVGRKRISFIFSILFLLSTMVGIVALLILLTDILLKGLGWIDWGFLSGTPSRRAERAGIMPAFFGTLWLILITAPVTFIVGLGTAIYLEEYSKKTWFHRVIETNISNLAGVPSIVYGLLGLTLFVRLLGLERSILAGALTMSLLVLPIVIVASQEAIRAVPNFRRHASYALGATRWQTIRNVVLPSAMPGILTGTILALSRAIGETAPLIVVGAVTFIAKAPTSPFDSFTVLPIQIFDWTSRPQEEFHSIAAAAIIVLLVMLLSMNAAAIYLRNKFQNRV
jgi:phosphate transport system permease protein